VEGDGLDLNAVLFESRENFGGKVKAGRRGSDRAKLLRVSGLVAVAIVRAVVAVDVGREGHVPDFVEDSVEVRGGGKPQGAFAELCSSEDLGFEDGFGFVGGVEEQVFAGLDFAAGADEGAPVVFGKLLG